MTLHSALSRKPATSRAQSLICAIVATTALLGLLTSCASALSAPKVSLSLYQPRVLQLAAGREVPTKAGIYRPQADEVWHSDAAFRQLEQENINLASALAQLRAHP